MKLTATTRMTTVSGSTAVSAAPCWLGNTLLVLVSPAPCFAAAACLLAAPVPGLEADEDAGDEGGTD